MHAKSYAAIVGWITIPLCFVVSYTTAVDNDKDRKDLLKQYSYLCGNDHICDENGFSNTTEVEHENLTMPCPRCGCDDFCSVTGECCIDIEFNTCVRTSFGSEWATDKMFYMKNYCPHNAEKELVSRCQAANTNENLFERNPVTSKSTNITYSNIYCARCNNDYNVLPWNIFTNCIIKLETFTTLDELWIYILNGNLSFEFIPTLEMRRNMQVPRSCNPHLINRCNITGVAKKFDYNVEKGCNTLYQPTGFFQNPFCLLCNTHDETFDTPISMCNATGGIQEIDEDLQSSCQNETLNVLNYPYKNEYCEKCNIIRTINEDVELDDVVLTIDLSDAALSVEIYNKPIQKFIQLKPQNQVYLSEIRIISMDYTEDSAINKYLTKIKFGLINNPKPAGAEEFGWRKKEKWCKKAENYFFPDNTILDPLINEPSCSCHSNCSELGSCCNVKGSIQNDVKKWGCVQTSLPRSRDSYPNSFFMISKCANKYENTIIKSLCEADSNADLSLLPVTDSRNLKTYKNFFCFLCSTLNSKRIDQQKYIFPWKMHIECPNIFNFKREVKFGSLMQKALSRNCLIDVYPYLRYLPPNCNFPGTKKLYCSLCEQSGKVPESCGKTNIKDPDYRSIFSIMEDVDESYANNQGKQCSTKEMYDKYTRKCRSLFCPLGKQLVNGQCLPMFLSFISKTYNIAFTANFNASYGKRRIHVDHLIGSITSLLTDDLFNDTNLMIRILNYHFCFNRECQKIVTISESHPLILTAFIKIHIENNYIFSKKHVDRNVVESRLFKAATKKGLSGNISYEYNEDVKGWFLPSIENAFPYHSHCNKRFQTQYIGIDGAGGIDITKLLFCPQISLSLMEFTFSNDQLVISVHLLNKTFYYNQFVIAENKSVRICANDYDSIDHLKSYDVSSLLHSTSVNLLQILTIITTSISLLSIVTTFIVYCILRKLRTIPGQNLMCFMCSLFFAQLFTLVKDISRDSMACTAVGMLTYFFWISVFTSATACCLHMFRVFACNVQFNSKNPCNRTISMYILYTYLTPLIFIAITIGYHMSRSSFSLTGFGGSMCFMDGVRTKLFSFIVPISAICFVNVVLFTITFCKIYHSPEMESGPSRNYLSIYLKLFLLTGLTWVFQIIDGFFDISPFSYLVAVLNGSQGLYIMISFVFNGRVKRMFQENGVSDKPRLRNQDVKDSQCTGEVQMKTYGEAVHGMSNKPRLRKQDLKV